MPAAVVFGPCAAKEVSGTAYRKWFREERRTGLFHGCGKRLKDGMVSIHFDGDSLDAALEEVVANMSLAFLKPGAAKGLAGGCWLLARMPAVFWLCS